MKFKYTALNQQNHQMTGVLDAETIDAAKEELHKMNLSILVINNISNEAFEQEKKSAETQQEDSNIHTFLFDAIDTEGKQVNGTIDSKDGYDAYKRLITNYHFNVHLLYKKEAYSDDIEGAKKAFQSNLPFWHAQMKEEGIDIDNILTKDVQEELNEQSQQVDGKIIQEVDTFVADIKNILANQDHHFSPPFMGEIQNALNRLERIKTSNNIKHVTDVCNEIYELVSHPDRMDESETKDYQQVLRSVGKETNIVKPQVELEAKNANLKRIKNTFEKIFGTLSPFRKKKKRLPDVKLKKVSKSELGSLKDVLQKTIAYLKTSNKLLRQRRKKEMMAAYKIWRRPTQKSDTQQEQVKKGISFLEEVHHFFGWLLFFYLSFFFLVNFSLEHNIGLSQRFVVPIIQSRLIVNITLFLIIIHFFFTVQNRLLKESVTKSLLFLMVGLIGYTTLISNF